MLHATSRTAKIALVAALAGLMIAVAIFAALQAPRPAPQLPVVVPGDALRNQVARELDRCSTLTMPDSGCEAAWAENRRRFFRQPAPEADAAGDSTVSNEAPAP